MGKSVATHAKHHTHSTLRESIVECVFISNLLRHCWNKNQLEVEVLKSEFDAHGYDVLIMVSGKSRYIQIKTGLSNGPKGSVSVSMRLRNKIGGCVLWIGIDDNLDVLSYWYFGGAPQDCIPEIENFSVARRQTPNLAGEKPERSDHRSVPRRFFERQESFDALVRKMFEL